MKKYIYNNVRTAWSRLALLIVSLVAITASAGAQEAENILTVPNFEGRIDRVVYVPIHLNNTNDVVAAQFNVQLPFAMPADGLPVMSNRANQHSASYKLVNAATHTYRVVIMSMRNNTLRGNSGLLLRLPMQGYDDGNTNTPYPITLSDIVLTDQEGNNIATVTKTTGQFTVSREDLPDLIVDGVAPAQATAQPRKAFTANYTVRNVGTAPTLSGWTERIFFESVLTGERVLLGSQAYVGTLSANGSISRSYSLTLPQLLHADGEQYVVVEVVPNADCGELTVDQGNNIGRSEAKVNVSKLLTVSANKLTLEEGYYYRYYYDYRYRDYITVTLARSGDWSRDEAFPVTCSVDGLLEIDGGATLQKATPRMVVIPARYASVTFRIYAVDDNIVRAKQADVMVGAANGYDAPSVLHITRTDNDVNQLTLTTSLSQMTEGAGQTLTLTATRGGELTDKLTLDIACTQALRFEQSPITIVMQPGQSTGSIKLTLADDMAPQLDVDAKFTARATDYQTATATVRLLDDDRPALTAQLLPSVIRENAGPGATTLRITRDRGIDREQTINVQISSSNKNSVSPALAVAQFTKGVRYVDVPVDVTDNNNVDGERTYTLTARLYADASGAIAPQGDRAYCQAELTVADDESPYLQLSSKVNTIGEGSSAELTVTRYVASTSSSLTVNLSAVNASDVSMPQTVTIPAWSTYTKFTVKVNKNTIEGDERPLLITARGNGVSSDSHVFTISDRTLPDAVNSVIVCETPTLYSGMSATLTATIDNMGTAQLPQGMRIDFYLCPSSKLERSKSKVFFTTLTPRTNADVAIGESKTFRFTGNAPSVTGTYWLYARLNDDGLIPEFSTQNNVTLKPIQVNIAAPFKVSELTTDRKDYLPGSVVTVTGRIESLIEGGLRNQQVNVTIEGNGQSLKSYPATVDGATGMFTAYLDVNASAAGMMTIKARAIGQTEPDMQTQVNVWNMSLTADNYTWTMDEGYPRQGQFTLRNLSGKTLTGLTIEHGTLPYGLKLNDDDVLRLQTTTLAAGESTVINYTANPTVASNTGGYTTFTVTARSKQGAEAIITLRYLCRSTSSQLAFETNPLNTTLLLGTTRTLQVKVTNRGLAATGPVNIVLPTDQQWLVCRTASPMASIEPGKSSYLRLELRHQPDMHSGRTFPAFIALNPENGTSVGLKLNVTVTGTEYSKLDVYATDVFTKASDNYVHVRDAKVEVTEARTGKQVMTGMTDGKGHWVTDKLTEGNYYVTMTAPRHKSVKKLLTIGPGDEQTMHFFLPYQAVLTNYVTEQDVQDGHYTMTAHIDIDKTAPQAIIVPTLPENGFECGSQDFDITLHNYGMLPATNVQLIFPQMDGVKFSVGYIPIIAPGSEAVVTVNYQGPEEGVRRSIAKILMHYAFIVKGELLSEDDYHQALVGCMKENELPPTIDPVQPTIDPDDPDDPYGGGGENQGEPEGPTTDIALPTLGCSAELTFDYVKYVTTDEPFMATLRVKNGQKASLSNIRFTHMVSNDSLDYTIDPTEFFTCSQDSLTGFQNSTQGLELTGNSEGTMRLAFTAGSEATPDGEREYYVGGQLAYKDAATGIHCSATLPQVKITVRPTGIMSVTYLLQEQYLGDNPDTEDIEEGQPGQMIMLLQNDGACNINELTISSIEPAIINNNDGLKAMMKPLYAALDSIGINDDITMLAVDSLPVGSNMSARWIQQSQADSHLDDTDLFTESILVEASTPARINFNGIHRLFRAVKSNPAISEEIDSDDTDTMTEELAQADAFLIDDQEDEDRQPDGVILADGTEAELQTNIKAVIGGFSGSYTLTVTADKAGWIYGSITDPTTGRMKLKSVERNGVLMSPANFWLTDHTVLSDYSTANGSRLHFADQVEEGQTVYTLTYEPLPDGVLEGMSIRLYTEDGSQVEAGQTTKERVVKAIAEFTKPVHKFFNNYWSVTPYDSQQKDSIKVSQEDADGKVWKLDMTSLDPIAGLHRIDVDVSKLKEASSRVNGKGSIGIEWTEDFVATTYVRIGVAPYQDRGSLDKSSGKYEYGEMTITATPSTGYEFCYWMVNGQPLAERSNTLVYNVDGPATIIACFDLRYCQLTVDCDEQEGYVSGAANAKYEYNSQLTLTAVPAEGYIFSYWLLNGRRVDGQTITLTMDDDKLLTPVFKGSENATDINETTYSLPSTSQIYNLQGQRVNKATRGIYIINGRKIVVK